MQVQLMIGEGSYGMLTAFVVSRVAPKVVHLVEHEVLYWYKSTCCTGTEELAFVVSRVAPKSCTSSNTRCWYKNTCFTGTKELAFVDSRVAAKVF